MLDAYDLQYAELLALTWSPDRRELQLRIRAPIAGWPAKELLGRPVERMPTLVFTGVTMAHETLLRRGHEVAGEGWPLDIAFEIDELDVDAERRRLRLRTEGLLLECTFGDCRIAD